MTKAIKGHVDGPSAIRSQGASFSLSDIEITTCTPWKSTLTHLNRAADQLGTESTLFSSNHHSSAILHHSPSPLIESHCSHIPEVPRKTSFLFHH